MVLFDRKQTPRMMAYWEDSGIFLHLIPIILSGFCSNYSSQDLHSKEGQCLIVVLVSAESLKSFYARFLRLYVFIVILD